MKHIIFGDIQVYSDDGANWEEMIKQIEELLKLDKKYIKKKKENKNAKSKNKKS